MADKAKSIDQQAHKLIESSKAEVDKHLTDYSSKFDEKIIAVQRQLSDIVEQAVLDLKTLAERGSTNIDEAKDTNHQVLNEHIEHWHTQLNGMKDRFQSTSLEQQSTILRTYNDEVDKKLKASQEEMARIAGRAKQQLGTSQKMYLNSLRRVERKLADEIDRLFFKFEAALTQEAKINLSTGGTRPPADSDVINKLHGRLKAHGSEIVKTFRRQVEQTESEFARSTQGSNERIESIRTSSVESLEKQVKSMRTDLERITRHFHNEVSELGLKLPVIEESGRAAALAVLTYKSAMLNIEND
jgi:F0F1-type ATP synthase membrane subunit b/b'